MDHDAAIGVLECRRAELVGELSALERQRAKLRADLRHIEGALHQCKGRMKFPQNGRLKNPQMV
ncbi:hypothetical protein [Azospirillum argentinense]|uniref:hypothetical protein n=1 Tax=Azospirillum argentinense TaxID=2970906 RepID=UPI0011F12347|nr:hypothetical protein [Azospirillum argentinense]